MTAQGVSRAPRRSASVRGWSVNSAGSQRRHGKSLNIGRAFTCHTSRVAPTGTLAEHELEC